MTQYQSEARRRHLTSLPLRASLTLPQVLTPSKDPLHHYTSVTRTGPMSFRPTLPLFKQAARSKTSGAWLSRQSRDPYIKSRASHPANFRSRSAFKLLEIHDVHRILTESWIRTVVDLGAAPGGWSQAVAQVYGVGQVDELSDDPTHEGHPKGDSTNEDHASQPSQTSYPPSALTVPAPTIIALDLLPILPIAGVHTLQADFLAPSTTARIASILKQSASTKPVDLLLSDMSANHTGNRATDVENILDLAKAVFRFAGPHLSTSSGPNKHPGGTLL
jgi:23S rRNA (uridine2552-2'-O)-methyltransferase